MNDQERFAALRERLSRQMRIKELGEDGEKRNLKTRFLVIGAGGLGSPALLYLASSGASHITVVDPDEVSENNLSRQILHDGSSIGLNKARLLRQSGHSAVSQSRLLHRKETACFRCSRKAFRAGHGF